MIDPIAELRTSLDVLSRAEIEQAWSAASIASEALGTGNLAARAEAAAFLLASILNDIGVRSERDDLADVAPAVAALSTYLAGRMITIVSDLGDADAA